MTAQDEQGAGAEECDIVMKGGITSGVVYPTAVLALAERYRFRNIGGASVGAIAAAVTAAAELGRRTGRGSGFAQLEAINAELAEEGFLLSLFKPRPSAKGLYAIALAAIRRQGALQTLATVIGQALWSVVLLLAWWATLALAAWAMGTRWWLVLVLTAAWALIVWVVASVWAHKPSLPGLWLGLGLALAWPLVSAVPTVGLRAWRDLSQGGFGLVPGAGPGALCDWLHEHIQAAAGLATDEPLTFGMLANASGSDGAAVGIDLQMMTTNLSTARPMRLPRELTGYAFDPEDLRETLPASVLAWLEQRGVQENGLVRLPDSEDIPVLLAFRMSLAFPGLFTAVRLYGAAPESLRADLVAHWFSDGGISSNFPVHFFDAWMPRRPTFALSFAPFPRDREGRLLDDETDVGLPPEPNGARLPRWVPVGDLGGFIGQILDTMQNWRDTLQSELPGFRDRVYEARLDKEAGEGGLNLGMDAATIGRLQARGTRVGRAAAETFDMDQHFLTRYLVTMQQLELGLLGSAGSPAPTRRVGVRAVFGPRRETFRAGDVGADELFGRDGDWLCEAGTATWELVDLASSWEHFGGFASGEPRPQPVMRVTPNV